MDIGAFTPVPPLLRDREKILDLFEWTCGARLLYNYNWVGGVSHDLPDGFVTRVRATSCASSTRSPSPSCSTSSSTTRSSSSGRERRRLPARARDLATTSPGPNLRGSGLPRDLRKDAPYCSYEQYEFEVAVGEGQYGPLGSCFDRNWVRVVEMRESSKIVHQALDRARDDGEGRRPREGAEARQAAEGRGLLQQRGPARPARLLLVVSDGGINPYRVKVKSPCFTAMSVFHRARAGHDDRRRGRPHRQPRHRARGDRPLRR